VQLVAQVGDRRTPRRVADPSPPHVGGRRVDPAGDGREPTAHACRHAAAESIETRTLDQAVVPAEKLVAPVARESHHHRPAGFGGDEMGRDGRRVAEGLPVDRRESLCHLEAVARGDG
jgi:hypothetical protein